MNKNYYIIQLLIILIWIHRAEPLDCYSCNSTENLNCIVSPRLEFIKKCAEDDMSCVIFLDNSATIRDCAKRDKIFKGNHHKCNSDLCNGILDFPPNRLKCYHCDGNDCIQAKSGNLQNCPKYEENDECFTAVIDETDAIRGCISSSKEKPMYTVKCKGNGCEKWHKNNICYEYIDDSGKYIVRGCSSDFNYSTCIKLGEKCRKCNDPGCNNNLSILKKPSLSCIKCDSVLDPSCRWTQYTHSKIMCKEYYLNGTAEHCYSFKNNDFVKRGCVFDDKICSDKDSKNCSVCSINGCNSELLIPQMCLQGITTDDDNNITLKEKKCSAVEQYHNTQGCYAQRTGSRITWGCACDLSIEKLNQCKDKNYKMCSFCEGDYCNQMQAPKNGTNLQCYKCNSVFNHDCVFNPGKNLPVQLCTGNQTECITKVFNNFSYRECHAPTNTKSRFALEVVTCSEHLCNGEIIPKDRLLCHQCTSETEECSSKYSVHEAKPCLKYMPIDECFEYVTYDEKVARGCKSDIQEYKKCLVEDSCKKCSTNGCNNYFTTLSKPVAYCIKCNNSFNSKCQWTQNNVQFEKCNNFVKIGAQEYCYSFQNSSGYVQRGCLNDEAICKSDSQCQLCTGPGCNRQLLISQVCSQGNASINNIPAEKKCNATIQTYENQGCYVKRNDSLTMIWGCASDLTAFDLMNCKKPKNNTCNFCSGKKCENLKAPLDENNKSKCNQPILHFIIWAIVLELINFFLL